MTLACENGEPLEAHEVVLAAMNPCPKHPHPSIRAGGLLLRQKKTFQKHLHPALDFGFYSYNRKVFFFTILARKTPGG